jgi:hypothetical protein
LRIGETPLAREIDGRDLSGRAARMMSDPVVVANGQQSLPQRSFAARTLLLCTMPGMALGGQPELNAAVFFDLELACEGRKPSCVELLGHGLPG